MRDSLVRINKLKLSFFLNKNSFQVLLVLCEWVRSFEGKVVHKSLFDDHVNPGAHTDLIPFYSFFFYFVINEF